MSARYLIGVDLGTSTTKAAVYDIEGALVAIASEEVPLLNPQPGVVEQESDDFYGSASRAVTRCMRSSAIDPRAVAAVAFDSQMAGIGAIDDEFRAATRFDSWLDMRCAPQIESIRTRFGSRVTRLTGCAPTCDHGPKMLWWKEQRPDHYARIAKFVVPSAYVAGRLAALRPDEAFIDRTFLHFTGVADAEQGAWSTELVTLLGIDRSKLPRIVEPLSIVGTVDERRARDFGLAPGTPIAAGCGDTAACALGAGVVSPGMLFDTAGTASVLAACTDRFVADESNGALACMRSVLPGLWHPLAYIAGGGLAVKWFRDEFWRHDAALAERGATGREASGDELYERMFREAALIAPGAEGLSFSPHLGGRICPPEPAMRGAWLGFTWKHTRAHFLRAILESVAFEYAYYLDILRELVPGLGLSEARVVGGGARGALWNQIKADVLGVPYRCLEREELGTWGAALVAGSAAGLIPDLAASAAEHAMGARSRFEVAPSTHARYAPLVERANALSSRLAETFRMIAAADRPARQGGLAP